MGSDRVRTRRRGLTLGGLLLLVVLLAAAIVAWMQYRATLPKTEVPRGESLFPLHFAVADVYGKMFSTADRQGRVVLVNIFATWCPPCQKETPHLVKLYHERHAEGLDMVLVSSEAESLVRGFAVRHKIPFSVIANGASIMDQLKGFTDAVPTTVLIDKLGNVRYRIVGADLQDLQKIRESVNKLLSEPPAAAAVTPAPTPVTPAPAP